MMTSVRAQIFLWVGTTRKCEQGLANDTAQFQRRGKRRTEKQTPPASRGLIDLRLSWILR